MATIRLDSQRTLVQANVDAGTAKLVEYGRDVVHGAADTLQLPLNVETGFNFNVVASAAAIVTIAAQSGETLTGDSATAAAIGSGIHCVKTGATTWVGSFLTGGAAGA